MLEADTLPIIIANLKHTPKSCPMFNDDVKRRLREVFGRKEEIAEKHEIKVLGAYLVPGPFNLLYC